MTTSGKLSDTPRTDAAHEGRAQRYLGGTVDFKFAAQLERELNTAHADGAKLSEALQETTEKLNAAMQRISELHWF